MDQPSQPAPQELDVDLALDANADEGTTVVDGDAYVDTRVADPQPEPTSKERNEAVDALKRAEVLEEETGAAVQDLMVRAYKSGGVPARIVSAGGASPPLPDLTRDAQGRAVLDGLDRFVRDAITEINRREDNGHGNESSSAAPVEDGSNDG